MFLFISLGTLNLIAILNYYFILAFVFGIIIRIRNYRAILGVIFTFSHRWPKLLVLAKQHKIVFLHWPILLPIVFTFILILGNTIASQFVWSQATVTFVDLWLHSLAFFVVTILGGIMIFLDCKAFLCIGDFDRTELEKNLDKAEHWLQSWHAPVLRFITFGLINPRKVVDEKVLEALVKASLIVNSQMSRWSLQIIMRLLFGLSLWLTWILTLKVSHLKQ